MPRAVEGMLGESRDYCRERKREQMVACPAIREALFAAKTKSRPFLDGFPKYLAEREGFEPSNRV